MGWSIVVDVVVVVVEFVIGIVGVVTFAVVWSRCTRRCIYIVVDGVVLLGVGIGVHRIVVLKINHSVANFAAGFFISH